MKICLKDGGFTQHAALFKKTVCNRIPAVFENDGMTVEFAVEHSLGAAESYRITQSDCGWKITGSDELGLYFGIGKFLHTATWEKEAFSPNPPAGVITPACSFRAMYFPFHHYQWYHMAPISELEDYVEDMLLWGYNTIICLLPGVNVESFQEPAYLDGIERLNRIFMTTKRFGMASGVICCVNQGIKSAPRELDNIPGANLLLRGNDGRNICPNKPGAMEYLKYCWTEGIFKPYAEVGLDYVITWPYDEGGCGCEKCDPWGAKGYLDTCKAFRTEALKYFPKMKFIISTWAFDDPEDEGEFAGLYRRLQEDMDWADYLMVDAHREFPQYPLEHEVIKPIVNFPEISMWGLNPWGGFGANPLPKRFQSIWDSSKHILQGGMPYSEGLYEDISKIQFAGYYWEPDRNYRDILAEYINYEYASDVVEEVLEIMENIEVNHVLGATMQQPDLALAIRGEELAKQVDARLCERAKRHWKWRVLYIRAILDRKRYDYYISNNMRGMDAEIKLRYYSGDFLVGDEEAQTMLKELLDWYHMDRANKNKSTLPPINGSNYVINGTEKFYHAKIY